MAILRSTGTALALSTGPWLAESAARSLAADAPGRLQSLLGQRPVLPDDLSPQRELFG